MITLQIPNWSKFNPRADRANYSWLRLQNDFFHDQRVFSLSASQKVLYLFTLCECSKKNVDTVSFTVQYITAVLQMSENDVLENIQAIEKTGLFCRQKDAERRGKTRARGKSLGVIPATNVTNERNETNVTYERTDIAPSSPSDKLEAIAEFEPIRSILESRKVSVKIQRSWLEAYPDPDWLLSEIRKALSWEIANPKRTKKNFGAFMTNWFSRGWDRRRHEPLKKSLLDELREGDAAL